MYKGCLSLEYYERKHNLNLHAFAISKLIFSGLSKKYLTSSSLMSKTDLCFHLGLLSFSIRSALIPSKNSGWWTNPYEILYSISKTSFNPMLLPLLICSNTTAILNGLIPDICFLIFWANSVVDESRRLIISWIESSWNIFVISSMFSIY